MNSKLKTKPGFTIIEVMIVLVIVALILLIVFTAIPAVQRTLRNRQRNQDALTIFQLISECMANNNNNGSQCRTPEQIGLDTVKLGIFTGAHYGVTGYHDSEAVPPTLDEPNWLFSSKCNSANAGPVSNGLSTSYGVYYFLESKGGDSIWFNVPRCLSNY